jgi:Kef-type K+ transport system membrane component KefB/voltage-gated potassium channel Kch
MDLFAQLSLIIVTTAVVSGFARFFKQPLTIAYIVTGLILAPFLFASSASHETLDIFSEMGISILLFIVGLHLSPLEVREFGRSSFLIGLLQVLLTSTLGFYVSILLGFSTIESVYVGVALSFSSTIIVLKLISDKKDLEKLYGRIAIGILLFQDLVAAVALIFSSAFSSGNAGISSFGLLLVKGIFIIGGIFFVGKYVLPKIGGFFAASQEYLLIFSLAWGFGLATLFRYMGFSIEIGALIAGVALSISPYSHEISARLRPLRDFFVVMFFVSLGSQLSLDNISSIWPSVLTFTLFAIVGKAVVVTALMGQFKYNKKTAFLEGISLAQLSEFSLVLLIIGARNGHVGDKVFAALVLTSVISITISSYLIMYAERLYPLIARYLRSFEQPHTLQEKSIVSDFEVILFGCNRVGYDFIKMFKNRGSGFLAVDFDPAVIAQLEKDGINAVYGDAEDAEFLEDVNVTHAQVVISTIPDYETSMFLLGKIREANAQSIAVVLSYSIDEALKLYEQGASYVILPHFISGEFAADLTFKAGVHKNEIQKRRNEHLEYLKQRKILGHSHPAWTHNS